MTLRTAAELHPVVTSDKQDLAGWNSDHPLFAQLIKKVQPKIIIEVGSWHGASLLHMAELTRELGTKLYSVDTWLGSTDMQDGDKCIYDYGRVWNIFLNNCMLSGHGARIYPIPQTSMAGARILHDEDIRADLIYLDASHHYEEAYLDLEYYIELLSPRGILFGDDWEFAAVKAAVHRFSFEHHLELMVKGPAWVLQPG